MATVFISYSRDSELHKKRVKRLVEHLRKNKIEVIFDEDLRLGERLPDFMEKGVRVSDFVLMCLTPTYKRKADARLTNYKNSGVAYENTIITGEIYTHNNQYKFIPILFDGTWESSTPYWAVGKFGIDLRGNNPEEEVTKLLKSLKRKDTNIPFKGLNRKKKSSKKNLGIIISVAALIVAIIGLLFGDNILGRITGKYNNDSETTQSSDDNYGSVDTRPKAEPSINELLNKLWEDSNYVRSEYVKNLINTGITRYNNGDFSYAGALFEQAIKEGDEGVTAKNNLAYMMRRQEYVTDNYDLHDLLEQCNESGGAFALINHAMYLVSIDEWGEADKQFRKIKYSDPEVEECISWWERLYNQGDCEGSLVLGWMLKYGFYKDEDRLVSDYFWDAKKYYENMPNFLYSSANINQKYDVKYKLYQADYSALNQTSHIGTVLENSNILKSYLKNLKTGYIYDNYFVEDNYSSVSEGFVALYQYAINFMGIDEGEYELYIEVQDYKPYLGRVLVNEYNDNDILLLQPKDKAFDYCFSLEVRNKEDGSFVKDEYRIDIGNSILFESYETSYEHVNLWVEYGTEISVTYKEVTQTETVTQNNQLITMYF